MQLGLLVTRDPESSFKKRAPSALPSTKGWEITIVKSWLTNPKESKETTPPVDKSKTCCQLARLGHVGWLVQYHQ